MIRYLRDDIGLIGRRTIVFDFDGTLGDTMPSIVETARIVLLEFGIPEEELGDLTRLVGPPFPQAFAEIYGVTMDEAIDITERYRKRYNHQGIEAWPAFEGVHEMLATLRAAGLRLVVASAKGHWLLNKAISDNGLTEAFDAICGKQNDMTYTKVDAIKDALVMIGSTPADAVMVGDRDNDAEASAALGIPCVGVLWGGTGTLEELDGAGCVAVVDTVGELTELLLELA